MNDFFTERLKLLRGSKNKAMFSRELGIPAPMYHRYENGQIPKEHNLRVIADHCGVTVDWLLGRKESVLNNELHHRGVVKLEKGHEKHEPPENIKDSQLHHRGVVKLEKGIVREPGVEYGGARAVCRYPEGCDIEGDLNDLREEMKAVQSKLDTVVGLLGAALGEGIKTTRPREGERKAG